VLGLALAPLQAEGWRLRHSLPWQGRGDIDSVAIAPTGVAVAVETKTRTYDERHLARVCEQAAWLSRRRRRWARNGALGVMCLVRARGVERVEHDVLVDSIDRLTHVLRNADFPAARGQRGMLRPQVLADHLEAFELIGLPTARRTRGVVDGLQALGIDR
jgi:hypothetical protein